MVDKNDISRSNIIEAILEFKLFCEFDMDSIISN